MIHKSRHIYSTISRYIASFVNVHTLLVVIGITVVVCYKTNYSVYTEVCLCHCVSVSVYITWQYALLGYRATGVS